MANTYKKGNHLRWKCYIWKNGGFFFFLSCLFVCLFFIWEHREIWHVFRSLLIISLKESSALTLLTRKAFPTCKHSPSPKSVNLLFILYAQSQEYNLVWCDVMYIWYSQNICFFSYSCFPCTMVQGFLSDEKNWCTK